MANLRIRILGVILLTVISSISLLFILFKIDPYSAEIFYFILFYSSFFIVAAGLFSLAGFYLRKLVIKNKIPVRLFKTSLKQGILISVILTGFLFLWRLIK